MRSSVLALLRLFFAAQRLADDGHDFRTRLLQRFRTVVSGVREPLRHLRCLYIKLINAALVLVFVLITAGVVVRIRVRVLDFSNRRLLRVDDRGYSLDCPLQQIRISVASVIMVSFDGSVILC